MIPPIPCLQCDNDLRERMIGRSQATLTRRYDPAAQTYGEVRNLHIGEPYEWVCGLCGTVIPPDVLAVLMPPEEETAEERGDDMSTIDDAAVYLVAVTLRAGTPLAYKGEPKTMTGAQLRARIAANAPHYRRVEARDDGLLFVGAATDGASSALAWKPAQPAIAALFADPYFLSETGELRYRPWTMRVTDDRDGYPVAPYWVAGTDPDACSEGRGATEAEALRAAYEAADGEWDRLLG